MERAWVTAQAEARKAKVEKEFGFNLNETNLNIVCNGKHRRNFPTEGLWRSPGFKWSRVGLGIWDFLMSRVDIPPPEEGNSFSLTRETDRHIVTLQCTVIESHLQTKSEIGSLSEEDVPSYSKVCGRAVLQLDKLLIMLKMDH